MAELVKHNPVNDPGSKPVKTRSKFKPNYSRLDTHVFGLNTPHFVAAGVGGDEISVRFGVASDSFNLKAPLMTPLKRGCDFFEIPLRAIIPNAAEKVITNPLRGDDIDAEHTIPAASYAWIYKMWNSVLHPVNAVSSSTTYKQWLMDALNAYQVASWMFLSGSLPKYLGYAWDQFGAYWQDSDGFNHYVSNDQMYEWLIQAIKEQIVAKGATGLNVTMQRVSIADNGGYPLASSVNYATYYISFDGDSRTSGKYNLTFEEFLRLLPTIPAYITDITAYNYANLATDTIADANGKIWNVPAQVVSDLGIRTSDTIIGSKASMPANDADHFQNLYRVVAYQLASAEFYSVDRVDDIYSSRIWQENMLGIAHAGSYLASAANFFYLNGIPTPYDACSEHYINLVATTFYSSIYFDNLLYNPADLWAWAYLHNLFSLSRSLKYADYFVGSRLQPLAVGNVDVAVNSNKVSVIDVTKNIQVQRFLNQVNRVGRKFSEYMKGVLGSAPLPDAHEPIFLGHVADTIGAEETDNTGADQLSKALSTTSKLRNNSSRYAFTVHVSEPCILIGITNYDIARAYVGVTDREIFHIDRYDMFNPFMQFVGDQEVLLAEILPTVSPSSPAFAYNQRYAEYKQRVDVCAGGFAEGSLEMFARILRRNDFRNTPQLSSDFIRSEVTEIDRFYNVLNGFSFGRYFHFIVRVDNEVDASRPMAFNPSIL